MATLSQLCRQVESVDGVRRASIDYDERGEHVSVSVEGDGLSELDTLCESVDAVMKVEGENPYGETEVVLR